MTTLEEMIAHYTTRTTNADWSLAATNWSNAKADMIAHYPGGPATKAKYTAAINKASYRAPNVATMQANYSAKMRR